MLKKVNELEDKFGVLNSVNFKKLNPGESIEQTTSNCELVIYVLQGKLSYTDNQGSSYELGRGETMAATCGNTLTQVIKNNSDKQLSYLQFEIEPEDKDLAPSSYAHKYKWKLRINHWLELVSHEEGEAQTRIRQDVNIHSIMLDEGEFEGFAIDPDRKAYLIQIEGSSKVNNKKLNQGTGLIIEGEDIMVNALDHAHLIICEMKL